MHILTCKWHQGIHIGIGESYFLLGNVFHILCISYFQNSYRRYSLIEINRGLNGSYARNHMLCTIIHRHWMLPCFLFFFFSFFGFSNEMGFVCVNIVFTHSSLYWLHVKWKPYSPCLPSSVTVLVRFKYNLHYTHASKKEIWDQ
jgi:hypothetical protein